MSVLDARRRTSRGDRPFLGHSSRVSLATHALGTFRISFWKFGPTELRLLLAAGTLQLLNSPWSTIAGHRFLLFDIGLAIGAVGILITFVVAAGQNTRKLYTLEPMPVGSLPAEAGSHRTGVIVPETAS